MAYKITDIEGIGPAYAEALAKAGVTNTKHLLEAAGHAKGRKELSAKTGADESRILKWVNMADLMRVRGVGEEYSELLEAAGVDTVKELRTRKPESLCTKMAEVNAEKKMVRRLPTLKEVTAWVAAAKELDPMVSH